MKKFDKDKELKRIKNKGKWQAYKKGLSIGIPCLLLIIVSVYFAYSKFMVSDDKEIVKTTVGEFLYGDIVVTSYINGVYSSTIPTKDEGYSVEKISCDNDALGEWNLDSWSLVVSNMSKRTKCSIYFTK